LARKLIGEKMSNPQILSPINHSDLKVITDFGGHVGDNIQFVSTFALEFRNIQSSYPIFFTKNSETGEFYPIALFGFEANENLFLNDSGWDASYIPMMIKRQPFTIGYQGETDNKTKPVVTVDLESPRISETLGEALFDDKDQPSLFLKKIISQLEALHKGYEHNKGFIETLIKLDLLEPFSLEITLNDGSFNQLNGFYTINEDKLLDIDGATLADLNESEYLQPIYMSIASYSRIKPLIDKKNNLI
jgi:hypothetical protein